MVTWIKAKITWIRYLDKKAKITWMYNLDINSHIINLGIGFGVTIRSANSRVIGRITGGNLLLDTLHGLQYQGHLTLSVFEARL